MCYRYASSSKFGKGYQIQNISCITGRVTTGFRMKIQPYFGRQDSIKQLQGLINEIGSLTSDGMTITFAEELKIDYLEIGNT
jgi:hypothetical protein